MNKSMKKPVRHFTKAEWDRFAYMAIHKNDVDKRNTVLADRITVYFDRANNVRAS